MMRSEITVRSQTIPGSHLGKRVKSDDLGGDLFPDVAPGLARWKTAGRNVAI